MDDEGFLLLNTGRLNTQKIYDKDVSSKNKIKGKDKDF